MRQSLRHRAVAVVVGAAVAGAVWYHVGDPGLSVASGLPWGFAIGVLLRTSRTRDGGIPLDWADAPRLRAGMGAVGLAAIFVSVRLPLSAPERIVFNVFVFGAILAGYAAAAAATEPPDGDATRVADATPDEEASSDDAEDRDGDEQGDDPTEDGDGVDGDSQGSTTDGTERTADAGED